MKMIKLILWMALCAAFLLPACQSAKTAPTLPPPTSTTTPAKTAIPTITDTPLPTPTAPSLVPDFSHIVIIIFENKEFSSVINNRGMPYFNLLANTFTLLTQHYAVTHPSLPNYLSMIGGDTFGITDDCDFADCYINSPSLPDLIEASGRTWKTYQDDMPEPCFTGNTIRYVRKHNPFIFFDPIRLDEERCKRSIVPLTQMDADMASGDLPNFFFITPDICYSAHDCDISLSDGWLKDQIAKIYPALEATNEPFLIILTWDEGQGDHSCCGLPDLAGGRIATILVSPQVRSNFQDATPYTHYSILKTISVAWGLPLLGHAADAETTLITAPWK
jgi:phosphatidylinositol-3-phosphatase